MLVSFSVSNFRSFSSEETFSLVANNKASGGHTSHAVSIPNSKEQVLRAAVLYGANGAGKSNLFKALKYVQSIAVSPRLKTSGTGREPFRLSDEIDKVSSFDLQFIAKEKLYNYGFKVDDEKITEEWLFQIGKSEKILFERVTSPNGEVRVEAPGFKSAKGSKVAKLAEIGGPQNQSFLATIKATLDSSDYGVEISAVLRWFTSNLKLIAPNEAIEPVGHLLSTDKDFLNFAGEFLKSSSTGVDHLKVDKREMSEEEFQKTFPKALVTEILTKMSGDDHKTAILEDGRGTEILIEKKDAHHFYSITISAEHENQNKKITSLRLKDESDGTRRLLQLIPALHSGRSDSDVYFIDEIDRSMHPMLIWKFLQFFMQSARGMKSQVIVTTHESNLLDLDLLRRDEIWFVEKDIHSSTRLYSLLDFKVRTDLGIRKHYLQGRFGAVPFLGNIDRLMNQVENNS